MLFLKCLRILSWCLLGLLLAGGAGAFYLFDWLHRPLLAARIAGGPPGEFRVEPGMGAYAVAARLTQLGAPLSGAHFAFAMRADRLLAGKISGAPPSKSGRIHVGAYAIPPDMTPRLLLKMLAEGRVLQIDAQLIEGWTFGGWRERLARLPGLDIRSAALSDADIMTAIGRPALTPEGRFFPDTYRVDKYSSDLDLFARAAAAMEERLRDAWRNRAEGLPYRSPEEALIMASIVEKETGQAAERAMVAGVFVNRLRLGMRLQTDPTVIYGLGAAFNGNLRKIDLLTDTPYNTYTRAGLPPTPIAMPSLASIEAALHPAETGALYFVARGDGSSHFSATLAEHNQMVNRYQRRPGAHAPGDATGKRADNKRASQVRARSSSPSANKRKRK